MVWSALYQVQRIALCIGSPLSMLAEPGIPHPCLVEDCASNQGERSGSTILHPRSRVLGLVPWRYGTGRLETLCHSLELIRVASSDRLLRLESLSRSSQPGGIAGHLETQGHPR